MTSSARVLSASTLIGDDVRNPQGEKLGTLKEIMLDTQAGEIAYGVLSFGGILGLGDKLFAVPWPALQLHPEEHGFVLNVPKDRLENAPGFDKDHWPDFADPSFISTVRNFYDFPNETVR